MTSGAHLSNRQTCYNGATFPCDGDLLTPPITQMEIVSNYNDGLQDTVQNSYDAYGMLTSSSHGQWGGSTLQSQSFVYNSLEEVTSSTTYDGSGNLVAQTINGYDG